MVDFIFHVISNPLQTELGIPWYCGHVFITSLKYNLKHALKFGTIQTKA